jgi:hypothetical protein
MTEELKRRVEPVECGAGHAPVEMYVKAEFGGEVTYACPTCGRAIALELFGGEVERELVNEGEFA